MKPLTLAAAATLVLAAAAAAHEDHPPELADHQGPDHRTLVALPGPLREAMLAEMRDHRDALQAIKAALAEKDYGQAADIAEQRLGMSSLRSHGARQPAAQLPEEMQAIGRAMHEAASHFAAAAGDAAATGDPGPARAALARVTVRCVACHSRYRLQ